MPHGGLYSIGNPDPRILDFSSNVNPLGYPKPVRRLFSTGMDKIPVYPDRNSSVLKESLAEYLGVSAENLVVGNGATEVIYNFCRALADKNTSVLVTAPTFGEYEAAARLCGAKLRFFKTLDLEDDMSGFVKKIPKNGIVFVCNPNNPTGLLVPRDAMVKILKAAQKRRTVVFVDECFIELAQDPRQSLVGMVSKFDNLFVLRSLTKSFGLAGLRIGYGVGNKRMITVLDKIKIPWNVSGIAQEAAVLALSDVQFLQKTQKLIATESEFLKRSISGIAGFSCLDSQTNFLLIRTKMPSKLLQKKLLKKRILIRDCSTFRGLGRNHIRIAVRTRRENLALVRALGEVS